MISLSSNCCRVDAVKASANQLKLQVAQQRASLDAEAARSADQQLLTVDAQVRKGDANKAELALSNAKSALTKSEALAPQQHHAAESGTKKDAHDGRAGRVDIYV